MVEHGSPVIFVDAYGTKRHALVTQIWGSMEGEDRASINLVVVSNDPGMTDTYGRQIGRFTSIPHQKNQSAPGNFWMEA